jgi:hypothetical protein
MDDFVDTTAAKPFIVEKKADVTGAWKFHVSCDTQEDAKLEAEKLKENREVKAIRIKQIVQVFYRKLS